MESNEQMQDAIEENIQEMIEEQFEELSDSLESLIESSVEKAFQNLISNFEFILPDGTHVIPKKQLILTSPDKTKVLPCYGGLRIEDASKLYGNHCQNGWGLTVQTRIDSWETIHVYDTKEDAIAALEKVKKAMQDGIDSLDL